MPEFLGALDGETVVPLVLDEGVKAVLIALDSPDTVLEDVALKSDLDLAVERFCLFPARRIEDALDGMNLTLVPPLEPFEDD